jgi:hypothetical protein
LSENDSRPLFVGAVLTGAILAGAALAVAVTAVAGALGGNAPSPVAIATPAAVAPTTMNSPTAQQTRRPTPSPSPRPSPTPSPSPSPTGSAARDGWIPHGCFRDGLSQEVEGPPGELIVAEDLKRRMPLPSHWSEAYAWVGSSANELFVSAFAACTGADPATIRVGTVSGGLTLGAVPFAIQVDGYTGAELVPILLDGYFHPEQQDVLVTGHHGDWTYVMHEEGFAVTASADTLYWIQVFCCVDIMDPDADLPSFKDIVHDYLDLTNDEPGPMPTNYSCQATFEPGG